MCGSTMVVVAAAAAVVVVGTTHLSSRVDDLCRELLAFVLNDLAEGVFDRWVVALDKVAVDKLHRKRGLACVVASVLLLHSGACDSQYWVGQRGCPRQDWEKLAITEQTSVEDKNAKPGLGELTNRSAADNSDFP
jgi:hypothetical protein